MKIEGKLFKFYLVRLQGYLGIISFLIILYGMVIVNKPFGLEWYFWIGLFLLFIPTILFIDLKYVYPREIKLSFEVNKELIKEFEEIKALIKERL